MTTIVMTGGTSGFGEIAAGHLMDSGSSRLIFGARRPDPALETIPLDLTSVDSSRTFARAVREAVGDEGIDVLVLNAGVIRHDIAGRTVDGFETTFAVNHLGQYLILRMLLPSLAQGARVVMTTSGTHDPATKAGLETPRHADAELLAHPDRDTDHRLSPRKTGEHAYTASKLCTAMTIRSLTPRPEV